VGFICVFLSLFKHFYKGWKNHYPPSGLRTNSVKCSSFTKYDGTAYLFYQYQLWLVVIRYVEKERWRRTFIRGHQINVLFLLEFPETYSLLQATANIIHITHCTIQLSRHFSQISTIGTNLNFFTVILGRFRFDYRITGLITNRMRLIHPGYIRLTNQMRLLSQWDCER
jgi:hypothetical protein